MRIKVIFFCLIFVFFFSLIIQADETNNWTYSIQDQIADDYGPGTYQYPTSKIFSTQKGLFDLQQFTVKELNENYILKFKFGNLTDPWESKFGFSLPLIELYIDNQKGGAKELFQKGANVKLDPEHSWNKLFKLSGWWLRVYNPTDKAKLEMGFNEDVEETPWEIKDCKVKVDNDNNTISVELKKQILGPLKGSHIFVLVGSFDPFGQDHFRSVSQEPSSWNFSDTEHDNLKYAPRVIDTIFPGDTEQKKALAKFEEDYPVLEPITLRSTSDRNRLFILKGRYLFLLILLAGLAIVLNRKNIFSNNR